MQSSVQETLILLEERPSHWPKTIDSITLETTSPTKPQLMIEGQEGQGTQGREAGEGVAGERIAEQKEDQEGGADAQGDIVMHSLAQEVAGGLSLAQQSEVSVNCL